MDIQTIPIADINPAPYNPRKDLQPTDPEYLSLQKSIQEFGLVEPLVWNKRTHNLIGGHQRFKIIKDHIQETEVVVVDLDDKREKALNIALNKIQGNWDVPKLKELLVEFDNGDIPLELTGFTELELEHLVAWENKNNADDLGSEEISPSKFEHLPIQCPKCGFEFEKSAASAS